MINKLLITCLQRNKRLIIPELGAFIRKNIDGVGVILVFVPFLNKDDGVLVSALQSWAGVERDEAEQILKEYVNYIRKSLDTRGQYIIEGVGVLKYDANGVIYLAKESEAVKEAPRSIPEEAGESVTDSAREESLRRLAESAKEIMQQGEVQRATAPIAEQAVQYHQNNIQSQVVQQPVRPQQPKSQEEYEREQENTYRQAAQEEHRSFSEMQGQRANELGTRYFSPIHQTRETEQEQQEGVSHEEMQRRPVNSERRNTINSIYGGGQSASSASSSLYGRSQKRGNALYGSQQASQNTEQRPPVVNPAIKNYKEGNNAAMAAARKKRSKGSDIVFIIAIVAMLLAIGALLYGFIFGKEVPLDTPVTIEQVVPDETAGPVTGEAATPEI